MNTKLSPHITIAIFFVFASSFAASQEYSVHSDTNDLAAINKFILDLEQDSEALASGGEKRANLADAYFQRFGQTGEQADAYRALDIYQSLSRETISRNVVSHSDKISMVYRGLEDKRGGIEFFEGILAKAPSLSNSEKYKAYVDYADLLDHFGDAKAEAYLQKAASLHDYAPGEAYYKWLRYLIKKGQPALAEEHALRIDERIRQIDSTLLQIIRDARKAQGKDVTESDLQRQKFRDLFDRGLGGQLEVDDKQNSKSAWNAILDRVSLIRIAHAGDYVHSTSSDDCRTGTLVYDVSAYGTELVLV